MTPTPTDPAPPPEPKGSETEEPEMTDSLSLSDFAVEKHSYSSNPWRVIHVPTGREVYVPQSLTNADRNVVRFNGPACFPRKRDAEAWVRDVLPSLLVSHVA